MSDNTIDHATTLWLTLSPAAKQLVTLTRDSAVIEKECLELIGRLGSLDKIFLLPYLRARAAQRFKNSLEMERREKLEALKRRKELRSIPETYPDDPYQYMSREQLLDAIVSLLRNRPAYEGARPLGMRLGSWLKSLEDEAERESRELRNYR